MKRKVAELLITPIGMELVENMALYISAIQTFMQIEDEIEKRSSAKSQMKQLTKP